MLQDLRDVHNATDEQLRFDIPKKCLLVETILYLVQEGKKKWHRHIPLIGGKAKQCEVYPRGLIRSILRGLQKQLKLIRPMFTMDFGPTNQEEDLDFSLATDDGWGEFIDEVSGKPLDPVKVQEARAEEIDYAYRYNVWTETDIAECYQQTGKGPISSRWIDLDKGDIDRPNYRSRLVIQEVRQSHTQAIFAATPPLESIRILLSLQRTGNKRDHLGRMQKVMFLDVRRAHWNAKIYRLVYVRLPDEAGLGPGKCGRLNKAMYGCRDAAACWELEITTFSRPQGSVLALGHQFCFAIRRET